MFFFCCFVYYRTFSWCRWWIFLAETIRKDWLLPWTNRIQAERKRCPKSWHCYSLCRLWEGELLTSACKSAAHNRNDQSELCSTLLLSTWVGAVHALWTGIVRYSQAVIVTLASYWQLCLEEGANVAVFMILLLKGMLYWAWLKLLEKLYNLESEIGDY